MRIRMRMGALLTIVVLGTVVVACGSADDNDGPATGSIRGEAGDFRDRSASEAAMDSDAAAPPVTAGANLSVDIRKVIVESRMELAVEDVAERYHDVTSLARRVGGFVADSRLTTSTAQERGQEQQASVVLRVPGSRHDEVMAELRAMPGGEVIAERTTSSEVTDEYTDLQSRLRNLQRSETRYLDLMDRAETVNEILSVGERLDHVRAQIEQIQGRINVLDDLVDFATISVTLSPVAAAPTEENGSSSFVEAWNSAWSAVADTLESLTVVAAWALVVAILVTPIVMIAGGVRLATARKAGHATE
jgi:hypothetical protein